MRLIIKVVLFFLLLLNPNCLLHAQSIVFGSELELTQVRPGSKNKEDPLNWVNVNTNPDTWKKNKDLLICTGKPIGIMRSEKQYGNFILQIEWKHMEAGGNSGVFAWSDANPNPKSRLPNGVEVQMLELDYINLHKAQDGQPLSVAYVQGDLFGVGGVTVTPDTPRGPRSSALEGRLGRDLLSSCH